MSLRLKGLDCTLRFADPNGPVASLSKILSFNINVMGEIMEEQYVGEEYPDFDEISNGVELSVNFHHQSAEIFTFFKAIDDRRSRRTSAEGKFSAIALWKFPQGRTIRGIVNDIYFGNLPMNVSGRKAYVATDLSGKAKKIKWL